jgi:hypothetical protein
MAAQKKYARRSNGGIATERHTPRMRIATNDESAVTRRNPPFSLSIFLALWQVCGESGEWHHPG